MSVVELPLPAKQVAPVRLTETSQATERIHYLDNLRALAMLLGVYLHAALAYAHPTQVVWLATDPQSSVLVDASFTFIHLFRMALFFLISGYFAHLVIAKKGLKGFIWNRSIRIALPFVLFYPFLLVLMTAVIIFATKYLSQPLGLIGVIVKATQDKPQGGEGQSLTTMHLWFLYYLAIFALLTIPLSRIGWLKFDWLFHRPWLLQLAPLALLPGIALGGLGLPATESFVPHLWPILFYGLFYWAGWQFFGRESSLESLKTWTWPIAVASLVMFIPYYLILPKVDASIFVTGKVASLSPGMLVVESLLTVYLSALLVLLALLLGQQFLTHRSPSLRFLSDASYWIYLLHLPVVCFLQTVLIETPFFLPVKLLLTTLGAFVFCLATYVAFVRYTPIGWMLNGKRSFP